MIINQGAFRVPHRKHMVVVYNDPKLEFSPQHCSYWLMPLARDGCLNQPNHLKTMSIPALVDEDMFAKDTLLSLMIHIVDTRVHGTVYQYQAELTADEPREHILEHLMALGLTIDSCVKTFLSLDSRFMLGAENVASTLVPCTFWLWSCRNGVFVFHHAS